MSIGNKIKLNDSYYSAVYDFALDIVGKIIDSNSWYFDKSLDVFNYKFYIYNTSYDKILKLLNDSIDIRLPISEVNDYFNYQNFVVILKSVFEDLGFKIYQDYDDIFNVTIPYLTLKTSLSKYFAVKQSVMHKIPEVVDESNIYFAIDFLLNNNYWKKDFRKDILYISYSLNEVGDNKYSLTFKIINRARKEYKSFVLNVSKGYSEKFLVELEKRLKLFGIDVFSDSRDMYFSTMDIKSVRNNFNSYYQVQTSEKRKRNY